jgi:PFL4705 family integrating conjugative element protein
VRSTSSADLDPTDPIPTPSPVQQATASPSRRRGFFTLSGVVIIAIAASGAYAFTAHSTAAAVKDVQAQLVDAENDFTTARASAQASIALADEYGLASENVTALKATYADSEATVTALTEAPNNAKASNEKIESLKKVLDQAKTSTNKLNAALAPIAGELDDLTVKKLDEAANKADQAVNEAKNLMGETDGKVKDNATRDGLQSTIDDTAKTLDEAREAVKNRSHVGDDRKWNVDEEKKLTDAVHALGEKSNQVRDSRGQWEAEQAPAASSNAGGSYSRSTAAGRSYSNNGGGAASQQSTGSAGGSQGGVSSSGQSYWVETQTEDPSLGWSCSGTLGSDPTRCWGNDGKEMHKGADGRWH